jgi:hypothetical protein
MTQISSPENRAIAARNARLSGKLEIRDFKKPSQ